MAKKKTKKAKKNNKKSGKKGKKKTPLIALLPLVPFKGLMIKQLKKQGVKFPDKKSKKLKPVAQAFHDKVIKKRNLEEGFNFEENIIDDLAKLATEIIGFIKQIFGKKKSKQPMDKEEKELADGIEKVQTELDKNGINPDDIIDEEGNTTKGKKVNPTENGATVVKAGVLSNIPKPVLIGGLGLLGFLALRKL